MATKNSKPSLSRFVVSFEVSYPGDFTFAGRFWRVCGEVVALNADEAVAKYQGGFCPKRCDCFMATDFPPAFDVLDHRRAGKFAS